MWLAAQLAVTVVLELIVRTVQRRLLCSYFVGFVYGSVPKPERFFVHNEGTVSNRSNDLDAFRSKENVGSRRLLRARV